MEASVGVVIPSKSLIAVRLFGYWRSEKLFFFLSAMPTILMVLEGWREMLREMNSDERMPMEVFGGGSGRGFSNLPKFQKHQFQKLQILLDRRHLFPFACHSLLLLIAGLFVYNVEVSTRLLFASSPFIYISLARIMLRQMPADYYENTPPAEAVSSTGGGGGVGQVGQGGGGTTEAVVAELTQPTLLPFLSVYIKQGGWQFLVFSYLLGYYIFGTMMHVNWLPYL